MDYIKGRPYAPKASDWGEAEARWLALASDEGAPYDDVVNVRAEARAGQRASASPQSLALGA